MAGALAGWLGLFKTGDSVRHVSTVTYRNRVSAVLGDIQGIGCRIHKPTEGEGMGWRIIVDGGSDIMPDTGGFITADRKVSVNDTDSPGTLEAKLYGEAVSRDSDAIDVSWVQADTGGTVQARHFISATIWNGTDTLSYIVGQTSAGAIVLVEATDTCAV